MFSRPGSPGSSSASDAVEAGLQIGRRGEIGIAGCVDSPALYPGLVRGIRNMCVRLFAPYDRKIGAHVNPVIDPDFTRLKEGKTRNGPLRPNFCRFTAARFLQFGSSPFALRARLTRSCGRKAASFVTGSA